MTDRQVKRGETVLRPNTRFNSKMAKPFTFNRDVSKVVSFVIACKLYIRIRMREILIEEQIQWVLIYV